MKKEDGMTVLAYYTVGLGTFDNTSKRIDTNYLVQFLRNTGELFIMVVLENCREIIFGYL